MKKHVFRSYRRLSGRLEIDSQTNLAGPQEQSDMSPNASFFPPAVYTFDIPDNSRLSDEFRKNHPRLYHVLNTKLWQNYQGA